MKLLLFLRDNQESTGLTHTTRLKREDIAKAVDTTEKTLRAIIKRLESDGFLIRQGSLGGRGESGIVFRVTEAGEKAGKGSQLTFPKGVKQGESVPTLVSSSSNDLKITTTDRALAERFQNVCERFGLHELGIGANDLMQVWRKGSFHDEGDFVMSIEHLAFYLASAEAKGITHPKAWMSSQLAKGFYPAPVGFKSWEERQEEARLEATRKRLARLEDLKRQQLDADFELWIAELSDDDKQRKLTGTPFAEQPSSKLARTVLRDVFKRERGEAAA